MTRFDVIVVGGGASGFFAAINCKEQNPDLTVAILEKTNKFLSKVKVSGGGRCNVTNAEERNSEFLNNYPRGKNFLKKAFNEFGPRETKEWFTRRGLLLKTEPDGRMFPESNSSQSVIDLLMNKCRKSAISLLSGVGVTEITKKEGWQLETTKGKYNCSGLIIAMGGMAKPEAMHWAKALGLQTVNPVPSLFTFKTLEKEITQLMGLSVEEATARISGIKRKETAPLLITHWGFSGPAIIKSSAWQARELYSRNYQFEVAINWMRDLNEEEVLHNFSGSTKVLKNLKGEIPQRLWSYLLERAKVDEDKLFDHLAKKDKHRLVNTLINDTYQVNGKSTFKEEFVTAGGIDLAEVNPKTMECHRHKGLFICGETLDVDGVTGGFNFQAAWTTGFLAGVNAAKS